jgi:hypothetical protein
LSSAGISTFIKKAAITKLATLLPVILFADVSFKQIAEFAIPEASQGVAVDKDHFYAVGNRAIAKYCKYSGKLVMRWQDNLGGSFIHLNSAVVHDGKLYAAHSNWPHLPVNSSIEVWNANTMKHIETHRFERAELGSLTWIDYQNGYWWGTFAHYESVTSNNGNRNTFLAKFDKDWNIVHRWTFPEELLKKFGAMSNSGGSWGPNNFLYVTGHDKAEVYKLKIPDSGSIPELIETIPLNIRGQGIAWDRYQVNVLYGVIRATDDEINLGLPNRVSAFQYREILK